MHHNPIAPRSYHQQRISFFEMLADFFKADVLDSDNQLECAKCKAMNKSKIRFRLKSRKFASLN